MFTLIIIIIIIILGAPNVQNPNSLNKLPKSSPSHAVFEEDSCSDVFSQGTHYY